MPNEHADTIVDHSLAATFLRFRLPAVASWLVVYLVISLLNHWAAGPIPVIVAAFGVLHAIFEQRRSNPSVAQGLTMDILVLQCGVWFGGSQNATIAFAMMFVVLASLLLDGRQRAMALAVVFTATGLSLTIDPPHTLTPGSPWLFDLLAIHPISIVVLVLSMATQSLRRAEVQRGYVLGTVAHELRNDLTPVVGMSSILHDELLTMERPDLAELAEINMTQSTQAFETIDDLLTMARLDRDALELEVRPINLIDVVGETVERYQLDSAIQRSIENITVVADSTRLRQIIRNLSTNAKRYGGDIVDVVFETDLGGNGHVLIRDNGPGIAAEDIDVVFEPFGRGSAGRRNHASVGLGLWLSRNLARAMNGDLTYRREDGCTVFDLRLPTVTPGEAPVGSIS
jgi:signal transduction histidine kinase